MKRLDESLSYKAFKKYVIGKKPTKIDATKLYVDKNGIVKTKGEENMKNIPKVIYLTVDDEFDGDDYSDLIHIDTVCWSEDRINKNDIKYVVAVN